MTQADLEPGSGGFVLGLALMGAGGLALLGLLIAGAPVFLAGLALVVLSRRRRSRIFVPALAGVAAFATLLLAAGWGGCSTIARSDPSSPGPTTCTAFGLHVGSEGAALLLALAAALAAGGLAGAGAHLIVGRRLRRRMG